MRPEITQKLRTWPQRGDKQTIAGARASHIEEVPLGRVDIVELDLVSDRLDARPQGKLILIAADHGDSLELQTLGEVHDAYANFARRTFLMQRQLEGCTTRGFHCLARAQ